MAIEIKSDTLIDVNHHFRVSAGPGAGKTHWLALHVAHVLKDSERLGKMSKIACLSYTNVGAASIRLFPWDKQMSDHIGMEVTLE